MAKRVVVDNRYDFRGGRVTTISSDLLNENELSDLTNSRISHVYGGVEKRGGSQRLHSTTFGTGIAGCFQWDDPNSGTKQLVVLDGTNLWYRNGFTLTGAFTNAGALATTDIPQFVPFRLTTAGAPLGLFIASGQKLWKWTGTGAPTDITGINGAPKARLLIAYHTRLFAVSFDFPKSIFWSKVGDGEQWNMGTKTDGGSALVDVLSGETISALEVIGSSLLIATADSISRFTGQSSDDIVIAQDTEGVSSEVGVTGSRAIRRYENVAGFLSERGPYAATETSVSPIAESINPDFATVVQTVVSLVHVEYHRGRRELWYAVPGPNDVNTVRTFFTQSTRLQAWQGPWTYSWNTGIKFLAKYFDINNNPNVMTACRDGFVRLMDVGQLDDVLADGTGGTNITMTVELPPLQFGDPGITKALWKMKLQATLPAGHNLKIKTSFDGEAFVTTNVPPSTSTTEADYRIDLGGQSGKRLRLQFVDDSGVSPIINGFTLTAFDMQRV